MSKERYSPEVIDNIRSMVSLPYIVQRYTHLNRHGTGLCPFHTERHPSFSVNAKKGLWHCFGCGAGGDIFDFVMRAENLTFPNAVKLLAFETGIRLPESDSVKEIISKRWQEKHKRLNKLNRLEVLFEDYENGIYSYIRFKIKCLPPEEEKNARDYTKELLLEQSFDKLDALVDKRIETFEEMRREVRNEKSLLQDTESL